MKNIPQSSLDIYKHSKVVLKLLNFPLTNFVIMMLLILCTFVLYIGKINTYKYILTVLPLVHWSGFLMESDHHPVSGEIELISGELINFLQSFFFPHILKDVWFAKDLMVMACFSCLTELQECTLLLNVVNFYMKAITKVLVYFNLADCYK